MVFIGIREEYFLRYTVYFLDGNSILGVDHNNIIIDDGKYFFGCGHLDYGVTNTFRNALRKEMWIEVTI